MDGIQQVPRERQAGITDQLRRCGHLVRRAVHRRTAYTAPLLVIFAAAYLIHALKIPEGYADSIAIWNLRARFFAFAPQWRAVFDPALAYSHLDYPPLIPLIVAGGWRLFGDTVLVPIVLHGLVFLAIVWAFRDSIWRMCLVGGAVLIYAPTQYADTPLALTLLAAVLAYKQRRPFWVGAALGLAALIKNEGVLMMAAFALAWLIDRRKIPWQAVMTALPAVALLIVYRHIAGVSNDVIGADGKLARIMDLSRYLFVARWVLVGLLQFANGALVWTILGLFIVNFSAVPRIYEPEWVTVPGIALCLIFLGYCGIYVITPHDLTWHLSTSFDRLVLQLFPAGVYLTLGMERPGALFRRTGL